MIEWKMIGAFAGLALGAGTGIYLLLSALLGTPMEGFPSFAEAELSVADMKKPLAVTMLLFLCFPVKLFVWIFLGAVIGSKAS